MLKVWDKKEPINNISAENYLSGNSYLKNVDVVLVTNNTGIVQQVLSVDILRANLNLDKSLSALEVGEIYLKTLEEQNKSTSIPSNPDNTNTSTIALALKSVEPNASVIKALYDMREISKADVYNYVVNGKITESDYATITGEQCPVLPLDTVRKNKITEISNACNLAIIGGFKSTAYQGLEKTYGSSSEDQDNITGNSQAAISKLLKVPGCENDKFYYHAQGEDFVEWTADECNSLARDFKVFKESQLLKSKALQDLANKATTIDEVKAINWNTVIPTSSNNTTSNSTTQGAGVNETKATA